MNCTSKGISCYHVWYESYRAKLIKKCARGGNQTAVIFCLLTDMNFVVNQSAERFLVVLPAVIQNNHPLPTLTLHRIL